MSSISEQTLSTIKEDKTSKMNPVVHFEMPYEKQERLIKFYSRVFGWQMKTTDQEYGGYVLAGTFETDEKGMLKKTGAINGGFFPKELGSPQNPSIVISVDDLNEAIKKVDGEGGKIFGEPVDIPSIGKYIAFSDTEGNRVGMLQSKET